MEFTVRTQTLQDLLNTVTRFVAARTPMPILECVLLKADAQGLRLTANDLQMCIETAPVEAEVGEPGSVALNARLFAEIVRKMPAEYIRVKTDSKLYTECVSGRARLNIGGQPGDEFPELPEVPEAERGAAVTLPARTLRDMIRQTIFSVAVESAKPILTGELMRVKEGRFILVAVDGFRIAYRHAELPDSENLSDVTLNAVVPAKSLNELSRALPDGDAEVNVYATKTHAVFECAAFTFITRLLEGEFFRYETSFNEDYTTVINADRMTLLTGFERATLVSAENRKTPVRLKIQDDMLIVTANTDRGRVYDEILCDIDGANLEIAFNPYYFIELLRALEEDRVIIKLTTAFNPCIVRPMGSDTGKYLILPLRILS